MGSFKVKLVGYFVLLALIPLVAAFWGFTSIAARSETRQADARLESSLRAALAVYQDDLEQANARAVHLAQRKGFAAALAARDRARLDAYLAGSRRLRIVAPGLTLGADPPPLAASRRIAVIGPQGNLGSVAAYLPLDRALARRLQERAGFESGDRVALLENGRVVAGPSGATAIGPGHPETVRLGGERYRTLVSDTLDGTSSKVTLAALTPQARIDSSSGATQQRLLVALLAVLILVGLVAWLEGRSIVRAVSRLVRASNAIAAGDLERRVPVTGRDELATLARSFNDMAEQLSARLHELEDERARLQDAITLFGEALAATHDVDQLLRVVLDAEVEATGATGGTVIVNGRVAARVGAREGKDSIEVPLRAGETNFGQLTLFGDAFDEEHTLTAISLAGHAVVALENARLHRIVQHQALVDGLTGLANRRHAENALDAELARAARFGGSVAFILCDLDNFKKVNDRFGHLAGDDVLRELASVLRDTVRAVDVASRWGGEEFALLLPATDAAGATQVAERAREALEQRAILTQDGDAVRVTASFGVASYPEHRTRDELLGAADAALYEAKRRGRNRVETAMREGSVREELYRSSGKALETGYNRPSTSGQGDEQEESVAG
jgi:diguanylate cyclase (GGDEF)-like protein